VKTRPNKVTRFMVLINFERTVVGAELLGWLLGIVDQSFVQV